MNRPLSTPAARVEAQRVGEELRRQARRLTSARQRILEALAGERRPMSIKEIIGLTGRHCCNLATVYRCVRLLEESRMVKRFDLGDGVARFELLREGEDGHHHHLICIRCSDIVKLGDCFADDVQRRIETQSGFKAVTHRLEFFGVCPECQPARRRDTSGAPSGHRS